MLCPSVRDPVPIGPGAPMPLSFSCADPVLSKDSEWEGPHPFLPDANEVPWSDYVPGPPHAPAPTAGPPPRRAIDPTLVVSAASGACPGPGAAPAGGPRADAASDVVLHCFFTGTTKRPGAVKHCNLMGHALCTDPRLDAWQVTTPQAPLMGSGVHPEGVENWCVVPCAGEGPRHGLGPRQWMLFLSVGLRDQHVAVCFSDDLRAWSEARRCRFEPVQPWMAVRYGAPSVWREEGRLMMALMGEDENECCTIGLRTPLPLLPSVCSPSPSVPPLRALCLDRENVRRRGTPQ